MIVTVVLRVVFRAVQILFAVVVLGASISLIKDQVYGKAPAATGYAAFAGAWGILTALVGLVAIWVEPFSGLIMAAGDGLAAIILLAAGILWAVDLRHVSCKKTDPYSNAAHSPLLNGGCQRDQIGFDFCGYKSPNDIRKRCQLAEADTVFMFLAGVTCIALIVLGLVARSHGSGNRKSIA